MTLMFLWSSLYGILPFADADERVSLRVSALSAASYAHQRTSIHCVDWVEDFVLCPLTVSNNKIEYSKFSTISDEVLEYKLRADTTDVVSNERYQKTSSPDKDGFYWATGAMDGYDAAGWLHPKRLEEIAGGPVLVAQPKRGMFCFWLKSNGELHKNMAVGIKEVYMSSKEPVSSKIYFWNGDSWMVWGEAVPSEQESSSYTGTVPKKK